MTRTIKVAGGYELVIKPNLNRYFQYDDFICHFEGEILRGQPFEIMAILDGGGQC